VLSRRQALKASAAAVAAAALAACGAPARQQVDPQPRRNLAASKADGRILFAKANTVDNGGKDDGIYALENAGKVRKLLSKADGDYAVQYPRWSPDGARITYVRAGDHGIFSDLWIANADSTNPRRITDFQSKIAHKNNVISEGQYVKDSSIVAGVSWSQGGDFITFTCDKALKDGALRPWTLEKPNEPPTPQTLHLITATQTVSPPNNGVNFHIDNTALSPDGSTMAFVALWVPADNFANKQTQIYALDFGTRKVTPPLTTMPWGAYDPAFSPDGQYIAFAARPDYRVNDLYIMTRDGKNQVQITTTGAARSPVWSPDGRKLAFLGGFEGAQFNIYVMDFNPTPGTPVAAVNFGVPVKITDEKGIDARSGLSWTA
jgi:TolB protein